MKEPASSLAILCVLFDDSLRFFVPFVITKGIDQFFEQNSEHVLSKKKWSCAGQIIYYQKKLKTEIDKNVTFP
jgi:hypothetical protein